MRKRREQDVKRNQGSGLEFILEFFMSGDMANNHPLGHVSSFVRDAPGRVIYETNANNEVLQFIYNPADEFLMLTKGKGQTANWNYDQYGRVTNKVDAAGIANFVYQYNAEVLSFKLQCSPDTSAAAGLSWLAQRQTRYPITSARSTRGRKTKSPPGDQTQTRPAP